MKKISFFLGVASLSLGACKKDSEPVPVAEDVRTSLLLAHDWKIAGQTVTYHRDGQATVLEVYGALLPCNQDDLTTFKANKTVVYGEGAQECPKPGEMAPVELGSWSFNNDQTELSINQYRLRDADKVFQVLVLTEKTLQIRHTYTYRINNRDYTGVEEYTYTAL